MSLLICLSLGLAAYAAHDTATQIVRMKVSEIAMIRVTGNPGTLVITPPGEGGIAPENPTSNSTYAQFTSITGGKKRKITVQWASGNSAPSGCSLKIEASSSPEFGSAVPGSITLTDSPQDLVTQIGSCYTGTGPDDGVRIQYTLSLDDAGELAAGEEKTAVITLTLSDEM